MQQVDALVHGMRTAWQKPGTLNGQTAPAYTRPQVRAMHRGDRLSIRPHALVATNSPRHKITNPTFLALVNDQSLRTIIIAGRPDLGHPDWRTDIAGRPLTDDEVTDVVAWLASLRSQTPGQPYPQHQ